LLNLRFDESPHEKEEEEDGDGGNPNLLSDPREGGTGAGCEGGERGSGGFRRCFIMDLGRHLRRRRTFPFLMTTPCDGCAFTRLSLYDDDSKATSSTPKLSVSSKDVRSTSIRPIASSVGGMLGEDGWAGADITGVLARERPSAAPNGAGWGDVGAGLLPRGAGMGDAMAKARQHPASSFLLVVLARVVAGRFVRRNLVAGERDHGSWNGCATHALQRILNDSFRNGWRQVLTN
jgi:hypothetical protein